MGRLPIELSRDTTETCEAMVFPHLPRDGPFLFGFTTGDDMPSRDPASRSQRAARHRLYALLPQVQWLLEASLDGQSWLELHRQDRARYCSSVFKLMCRLLPVTVCNASAPGHKLCHADVAVFNDAALRCYDEVCIAAGPSRWEKAVASGNAYSFLAGKSFPPRARTSPSNALPVAMVLTDLGALTLKQRRALKRIGHRDVTSAGMGAGTRARCHDRI